MGRSDDEYRYVGVYKVFGPYNDGPGREYFKVIVKLAHKKSGALVKRTTRAQSREEAEAIHATVAALVQAQAQDAIDNVATIDDLMTAWRESEERRKPLTPNRRQSIRGTERRLRPLLPKNRKTPITKAVRQIRANYLAWVDAPTKFAQQKKPRTLKNTRITLIRLFDVAKAKKWLTTNPFLDLDPITERNTRPDRLRLTVEEALVLWKHCRELVKTRSRWPYWTKALGTALLLGTGMRVGDLVDAQVRGLDTWRGQRVLRLFYGKTENAARILPLEGCPWLLEALVELTQGKAPHDYLFQNTGLPDLAPQRVRAVLKEAGNLAAAGRILGITDRRVRSLAQETDCKLEPIQYSSQIAGAGRRLCRNLGLTAVGPHGLRRTFTDLRAMVSEDALREMASAKARRQLGHAPGSSLMETTYLSPELSRDRETLNIGSVIAFLEGSEHREVRKEEERKELELVQMIRGMGGAERVFDLLKTVSTTFPKDEGEHDSRRRN